MHKIIQDSGEDLVTPPKQLMVLSPSLLLLNLILEVMNQPGKKPRNEPEDMSSLFLPSLNSPST